jgi:ABC-2 type transport system permease protein
MTKLLAMEFSKLIRLSSVRFSVLALILFPLLWAYSPGIFAVYGQFVVSSYQVPGLALLSSMQFFLPLLVAISSAELLGTEISSGTLPTILLRPVTRSQWLFAKVIVAAILPFALLVLLLVTSLLAGSPFGFGGFPGGTGIGEGGLLGVGFLSAGAAIGELLGAYFIAAFSLVPISLLAILFAVVFMNAASGALATMAVLIFMNLLVIFPFLQPYLLTAQLSAYVAPVANLGWVFALIALYCAGFAALSVILFERKDF